MSKVAPHSLKGVLGSASQYVNGLISAQVHVPADLATVSARGHEAAPERAGLNEHKVSVLVEALENLYRSGAYPGVAFCLRRRGEVVLDRALGHARGNAPQDPPQATRVPMKPDTPVCLFSASKAVTAILAHALAEDGGIELDAPVAHYWSEFGRKGKARITIHDVLCHRAGIPSLSLPRAERNVERLTDWDWITDRIARATPTRIRPMAYHAITGGFVIGEIVRRVTGAPITDYLDKRLRQPLGMQHFTYGLPVAHRGREALNAVAGMPVLFPLAPVVERALIVPFDDVVVASNTTSFLDAVIPAGNLYATAEELSRFFQMLLAGGQWQGRQVLKAATVARAVEPVGRTVPDATLMIPMRYSEGMMLGGPMSLFGPRTTGVYGHLGFMNILGWADPRREIACSLLVTGKAILGPHLASLFKLLSVIRQTCED